MESSRFDAFVRVLDRALSRRAALAAMVAALPAAPLSALEPAGKGQRRRKKGQRRGGNGQGGKEPRGNAGSCDAAACAAAGGCCTGNTCVRHAGPWTPQTTFGRKGDGPDQFVNPVALAVSADERTAWVAEQFRIKIWVRSGDDWVFQTQLGSRGDGSDQFEEPGGVALIGDGQTLLVTDTGNSRISVWTRSGNTWVPQTTFGSKGDGPEQFDEPLGLAVSADGRTVWVADQDNHRVSVWTTRSGNTWGHVTTFGSGRGRRANQFDNPTGIAVSPDGQTVVVADTGNFRISVWARSGNTWVNQATFGGERDQFDNPRGVVISPDGQTIWVADSSNNRMSVWAKSGNTWVNRTTFGSKGKGLDEFDHPEGLAVSASGRSVWVADTRNHRIAVWASGSPFIWGNQTTFGREGEGAGQFHNPTGVAVSGDGQTAWVADFRNDRVSIWGKSGRNWIPQGDFGGKGDGPGEFKDPIGIAVGANGQTVWVTDAGNARVSVWTKTGGAWLPEAPFGSRGSGPSQFRNPRGLAVSADGQTVWVADQDNDRISVWTRSGSGWVNLTTFGDKGDGPGQFNEPWGVAVSADGQTVWVADEGNFRISVWTRSGNTWVNQTTFGSKGEDLDRFDEPRGVAVSADGQTVWVGDFNNHRVSVWIKSGSGAWRPQTTFGGFGGDSNELRFPNGVALGADQQTVWVADTTNNRVSVWALTCPPA